MKSRSFVFPIYRDKLSCNVGCTSVHSTDLEEKVKMSDLAM